MRSDDSLEPALDRYIDAEDKSMTCSGSAHARRSMVLHALMLAEPCGSTLTQPHRVALLGRVEYS